jgi:hypothetical protein
LGEDAVEDGFFSSEVTVVDFGVRLGLADLLLDLCISPMRSEARLPEAKTNSQRGNKITVLYSLARMLAK